MGILIKVGLKTFDNTDNAASVGASATVTIRTISGKGSAVLAFVGDGGVDVTMKVSVDGGADISLGAANSQAITTYSFSISLVIKATNAGSGSENYSTVSSTGTLQA